MRTLDGRTKKQLEEESKKNPQAAANAQKE
jgi:hypothetical protein